MEVKVNKEIRNYTESVFFGLSLRQCIFSVLAIGVAVGVFFGLRNHLSVETVSWICILGAAPFAAMGFITYHGMTAEQLVWAWLKSEFIMPKRLTFQPTNIYYEAVNSHEIVGERNNMTGKQVQRFIKLNDLSPELMEMLDNRKISFTPALEIAFINPKNHALIASAIEGAQSAPSLSQAQRMREMDKKNLLTPDAIDGIMLEQKKEVDGQRKQFHHKPKAAARKGRKRKRLHRYRNFYRRRYHRHNA